MQLSHYLTPKMIVVPVTGTSKEAVLKELVHALTERAHLKGEQEILHAISEREKCASTFLPMGVAVPHARVPDIHEILMITGIISGGIKDTIGTNPLTAHIVCLFVSPTQEKEFGKHLKLLARIAAIFAETSFVKEIAAMTSPEEIFTRIQKRERLIDKE